MLLLDVHRDAEQTTAEQIPLTHQWIDGRTLRQSPRQMRRPGDVAIALVHRGVPYIALLFTCRLLL